MDTDDDDSPDDNENVLAETGVDGQRISAAAGGSFHLYADSDSSVIATFTVPAGSIPSDTTIKVRSSFSQFADMAVREFEFGPEGLTFSSPAILEIDLEELADENGNVPESLYWLYFNPDVNSWELEDAPLSDDDHDGIIRIEIHHFSKYRITTYNVGLS